MILYVGHTLVNGFRIAATALKKTEKGNIVLCSITVIDVIL